MSYEICKKCERFFKRDGNSYCEHCRDKVSGVKETIDDFLEKNPNASVMEIAMQLKIPLRDINTYLDAGGARLSVEKEQEEWISPREQEIREETFEGRRSLRSTSGKMHMGRRKRR